MRRALCLAVLLVFATGFVVPLAADYRESYSDGIRQGLDRENWTVLATYMREAIAEQPQESQKRIKLYGSRFSPYFPHYYLGLALYQLGDTEGALREWEVSEEQGAIVDLPKNDFGLLQSRLGELRSQVAAQSNPTKPEARPAVVITTEPMEPAGATDDAVYAAAESSADQALSAAEALATEVAAWAKDPLLQPVWASETSLGRGSTKAGDRLLRAKKAIAEGKKAHDADALTAAAGEARGAREDLAKVRDIARGRKQSLVAERESETQAADQKAKVATVRANAARDLDRLERTLSQIAEVASDEDLATVWKGDESLGGREKKAKDLLGRARALLEQGSQSEDLQTLELSQNLAKEALSELGAVARTAPERRKEIQLARQQEEERQRSQAEAAMATSDRAAAIRKDFKERQRKAEDLIGRVESKKLSTSLAQEIQALRSQLSAASRLSADAGVDLLDRARTEIDAALRALSDGLTAASLPEIGPPANLLSAAEAYFRADYEGTAKLLAEATFGNPKAALQAHLFRAAARYALFVVGGEADDSLKQGSATDIRALLEIDQSYVPKTEIFSPRFVRFFAETHAAL